MGGRTTSNLGDGEAGMLTIGALARATGIPVETLRTWERRYGYPEPDRKPSGHRLYPIASVPRLRRVAEALARGHRAAEVVGVAEPALAALLAASPAGPPASSPRAMPAVDEAMFLDAVARYDVERLTRVLCAEWGRLGPLEFLRSRVGPLVRRVGTEWKEGRITASHEHFVSERIGDILRAFRLPYDERARGPLVVLATLPGEQHGLGLQMAALVLATVGLRVCYLGTDVPVVQVAGLARDLSARAVGVSMSSAHRGARTTARLTKLRAALPRRVTLLVGGDGAPGPRGGIEVVQDLTLLDGWGRRLVAAAS